jgi:hypothetical protein
MSNPDSGREVIELDDRSVRLESEAFLRRYALLVDNDQDEVSVWRLFGPSLVDWLTGESPEGFSFELQDGSLCCFVPGTLTEAAEFDQLCEATSRVLQEVTELGRDSATASSAPATSRSGRIDAELAKHHFDQPPKNVKAAAKALRHGLRLGDEEWKLGAEAFFREHASEAGFQHIAPSEFRASHLETHVPGLIAHVGKREAASGSSYLLLANSEDFDGLGWSLLYAGLGSASFDQQAFLALPRGISAERGLLKGSTDGRSVILSSLDGGERERTSEELRGFLAACAAVVG